MALFQPPSTLLDTPSAPLAGLYFAERPIRRAETPSNPFSRPRPLERSLPPLHEGGERRTGGTEGARGGCGAGAVDDAIALHWVRVITPNKASR